MTAFTDFLEWFRRETEAAWAKYVPRDVLVGGGKKWQPGSRWIGLDEASIQAAELAFGTRFPPDYRLFVARLHTLSRPMLSARYQGESPVLVEQNSFSDWSDPVARRSEAEDWLVDGLIFDVENEVLWPDSWGRRPSTEDERALRIVELVRAAPPLIPVFGHRFIVPVPCESGNPVLSIHQSDAIVYADDLEQYLRLELRDLLPPSPESTQRNSSLASLPFWGEIVG